MDVLSVRFLSEKRGHLLESELERFFQSVIDKEYDVNDDVHYKCSSTLCRSNSDFIVEHPCEYVDLSEYGLRKLDLLLHHGLMNFQKLLNLQEKCVIYNGDFRLFRISQILKILHSLGMPLKLIEHIFADFLRLRVS